MYVHTAVWYLYAHTLLPVLIHVSFINKSRHLWFIASTGMQNLQLAMNPTSTDLLKKEAVALFLAIRARKSGGVFSAIRGKALEILDMLPAGSVMPDAIVPAVAANIRSRASSFTAGYAFFIRVNKFAINISSWNNHYVQCYT